MDKLLKEHAAKQAKGGYNSNSPALTIPPSHEGGDIPRNVMNPHRIGHGRRGVFLVGLLVLAGAPVEPASAADNGFFRTEVAPILEQHCLRCHGPNTSRGGLSLATAMDLAAGGDSGPVLVVGKPDDSLLLEMVSGEKPKMPKKAAPLSREQVAVLRKWIGQGAPWPRDMTLRERKDKAETWWSLRPLARPPLPRVQMPGWVRMPLDTFILHRLEERGMRPTPEADRRTLIRRLYFDLLGLPPAPAEIDAFVRDRSPNAYERLVDRLLASPHYGERWARHWLDVVHYGDTHGYDKDKVRPNAWPYRDYVIRAFNEDRPYSRFIEEQIAGDVLYPDTRDGIVGLGFLAAGPWDFVGHVELREGTLDKKITRNLDRDDMVATVLNTFTSLTAQCARCHDHKFDPITQEDYYSLQAVFAAVDRADRPYEVDAEAAGKRIALKKRLNELAEQAAAPCYGRTAKPSSARGRTRLVNSPPCRLRASSTPPPRRSRRPAVSRRHRVSRGRSTSFVAAARKIPCVRLVPARWPVCRVCRRASRSPNGRRASAAPPWPTGSPTRTIR